MLMQAFFKIIGGTDVEFTLAGFDNINIKHSNSPEIKKADYSISLFYNSSGGRI
jgi:hypothetical protein